mgnify:CR=1 FL=1
MTPLDAMQHVKAAVALLKEEHFEEEAEALEEAVVVLVEAARWKGKVSVH